MKDNKQLSASAENYLKAIYLIVEEKQAARVKDISKYLKIGASSVSEALRGLASKDLINYEPYGIITLTEKGKEIALEALRKHDVIVHFFSNVLSVELEEAEDNAKKIEHDVSEDVLEKFVRFLDFMKSCSCKEPKWMKSFKHYSEQGVFKDKCQKCMSAGEKDPDALDNSHCCGMHVK